MNKKHLLLITIILLSTLLFSFRFTKTIGHLEDYSPPRSGGAAANGLGDRTGSPLSSGTCSNCHSGGIFSPNINVAVRDNALNQVTSYVPGENYTIEYTVTNGTGSPSGYAMQSVLLSGNNAQAGDLTTATTPNTQIVSVNSREYVDHQQINTTGVFKVNWTAPNSGFGNVSIYAIGLAANGNGSTSGDKVSTPISINLTEACTPNTGTDTQIACTSYTWIDGNTYTTNNNTATHTETNASGCDSIVTLNLTINNTTSSTDIQAACDSYTWIDGNTYTSDNNSATHTLTNTAGCDSIVTLSLTINNSTTATDTQTACDSFTWIDGNTYTSSNNIATFTTTNAAGCDSVTTLNLTINNSNNITDTQTACSSFTWIDGNTYTSSNNTATHTITNINNCDSIITLDLTINTPTAGTDAQVVCTSLDWIDGNTYTSNNNTATHTITNAAGCDSLVTLNLTISSTITATDVQTACGPYTWTNGVTYSTNNNTATQTLTSHQGCDSIVTLDLTINNPTAGTDNQVACNSYTWIDGNTYTTDNNSATFTLTNSAGCDSVVTLNLTITDINNSVTQAETLLTADASGAAYQWLNCPSMTSINGATNQSYTATTAGDYAVIITQSGCSDTSLCYTVAGVGVTENNFGDEFIIYPNPTSGNFSIDLGDNFKNITVTMTNLNGKLIQSKTYSQSQLLNLKIEEPKGVYQLLIETETKKALVRLIKE